jgi:CheY-like chemotaxis protein
MKREFKVYQGGFQNTNRILIVDDNEAIHEDFRKILSAPRVHESHRDLQRIELELFDEEDPSFANLSEPLVYEIDSAFQGLEALEKVDQAAEEGRPYAMILMDVRMPPGINGIEAIEMIWKKHPFIEMVIVTAFSDYSWESILQTIGRTDRLMFLRKPFDQVTVKQMALALTKKYNLFMKVRDYLEHMESEVRTRNYQLEQMVQELKGLS